MQVDGYSLDAQRDKLRKYAEYQDMEIAAERNYMGLSHEPISRTIRTDITIIARVRLVKPGIDALFERISGRKK